MKKSLSKTQRTRVHKMKDREIDYSDNPSLDEDFFREAVVWVGTKKQITLRNQPSPEEIYGIPQDSRLIAPYWVRASLSDLCR